MNTVAIAALASDPVFDQWAVDGLVWLPEHGMGRLKVTAGDAVYDRPYWEKYVGYAATDMGKAITRARIEFVQRHHFGELIDVGIGCGDFVRERGGHTWGYDVNPAGIAWLHSMDRWSDPYEGAEAVSLWDVLEHIPEPAALLRNVRRFVFCSLPIVPGDGPPPKDWRHLRRDEHPWYWTRRGLVGWMAEQGFELLDWSDLETELGRQDISSFCFERVT